LCIFRRPAVNAFDNFWEGLFSGRVGGKHVVDLLIEASRFKPLGSLEALEVITSTDKIHNTMTSPFSAW